MSETVHYKGTLKPTGKTILEFIKGDKIPDYYDNEKEYFEDEYYQNATLIDNQVYTVEKEDVDIHDDILNIKKIGDNFEFEFKYYNGGCCFEEALEYAFKKLSKLK